MGNIIRAKVLIEGNRPLLWHHFGPDALPLEKQERTGVAGHDPEEWRKTVLVTKDGQLYVEPTYIFGCIRDGAKFTKKGKGSVQSAVAATLQVTDERVLVNRYFPGFPNGHIFDPIKEPPPIADPAQPVFMHISSVRNPSTRARNVRYRIAASSGWQAAFNLLWDKTVVSRGEMEAILHDAGVLTGLGDGRSIGFGRFQVCSVEYTEQ